MIHPLGFVATLVAVVGLGGYVLALEGPQAVQSVTGAPAVVDPSAVFDGGEAGSADNADQDRGGSNGDDEVDGDVYRVEGAGVDLAGAVGEGEAAVAGIDGTGSVPGRRLEGLTYAPVGDTAVDAAERFLDLLGITGVEVLDTAANTVDDSTAANTIDDSSAASDDPVLLDVRKLLGDGDGSGDRQILTTLVVAPIGGAFVVEEARSPEYDFAFVDSIDDDPTDDGIDDAVTLIDRVAVQLTNSTAQSYSIELKPVLPGDAPFPSRTRPRAASAIIGASRVWVVVSGSSARPGPFSAKPAYVLGADDTSSYTAVGLPPDDRDGGLVLRSTPNGERVGVIGLGSDGVRRRSVAPRLADGLVWWAVTAPDGREGWVASGHLAANDPIDDTILVNLAGRLAGTFGGPSILKDEVGFAYPVYVGPITRPTLVKRGLDIPAGGLRPALGTATPGRGQLLMQNPRHGRTVSADSQMNVRSPGIQ